MRALSIQRPAADNALLRAAARGPRMRYAIEGLVWSAAFGVVVGALWFGVDLAGPYLRSLG
ncbi:hypothetical protein BTHA_2723 [Burkholderia thailandensis MSMB59]|uniref:hypothetical protein n=1 Tax=Burkholderia thailandensis TaxID=57975 RepID=UPI00051533C3|nr:hypothetical protein [Burkholderia thailandensis]AIS97240.1 hypothetical protein BTHA_2723 [Burkholderia thailandensis MSMB59]AOJ44846.1 hypothetical protein WJ27_06815 [Burkholderia thailandensis]KVG16640.1 hypothetical protein WJ28_12560 [Burkholderia thailandensis]